MKLCSICKEREQLSYNSHCRECHNEYQKAWYKKNPLSNSESFVRRRKAIRQLIVSTKNRPCMDCNKEYPYYVMDFDHVRGTKKINLGAAASKMWALATIQAEIDKCDVVCANCHRERTFKGSVTGSTSGSDPGDVGSIPTP